MALVPRFAEAFKDAVVRGNTKHKVPGRENPGFGEHDGVLDGGLVNDHVAMAGVAFCDMLLIAMDQSMRLNNLMTGLARAAGFSVSMGAAQPGFVAQTGDVDNQRIAFPMANRIAQKRAVEILGMWPALGVNEAISLTDKIGLVQNHNHFWRLHKLQRNHRHPANAHGLATVPRILRRSRSILVFNY